MRSEISCCAIGRSVAEATNACRMRRTRGEIGRFRRRAAAVLDEVGFFPAVVDFFSGFFAPDWSGSVFGGTVFGALGDSLSGESAAAGFVDCCGETGTSVLLANAHAPARASVHQNLRLI